MFALGNRLYPADDGDGNDDGNDDANHWAFGSSVYPVVLMCWCSSGRWVLKLVYNVVTKNECATEGQGRGPGLSRVYVGAP